MPWHAWIGGVGAVLLVICLSSGHPRAALLVTALCAYSWGALLVEAVSRLPAYFRRRRYRGWEGRYYEFDGRQLRVEPGADDVPWAWLDDVLREFELKRDGLHLGGLSSSEYRRPLDGPELLSLAGIERLARVSRTPSAARFARWFEGSVHRPAIRRAATVRDGRRG